MNFSKLFIVLMCLALEGNLENAIASIAIGDHCPVPAIISYLRGPQKTIGVDKLQIEWNTKNRAHIPVKFISAVFVFNENLDGNGMITCNYVDRYNNLIILHPEPSTYYRSGNILHYKRLWKQKHFNGSLFLECTGKYTDGCPFDFNVIE